MKLKVVDEIFELLSNGGTWSIDTISERLNMEPEKVQKICAFLFEFGLANFDGDLICLTEKTLLFLKEVAETEAKQPNKK